MTLSTSVFIFTKANLHKPESEMDQTCANRVP